MRLQTCSPALAGTFLGLLLAGCGDGLAGPATMPEPETAALTTELSVGLPDPAKASLAVLVAPDQKNIPVDLGDGRFAEGRFQATLHVLKGGKARGHSRLEYKQPYEEGGNGPVILLVSYTRVTQLDADDKRFAVQVEGAGQLCSGEKGQDCRDLGITGTVDVPEGCRTVCTGDDPIWTFQAAGVHSSQARFQTIVIRKRIDESTPAGT